ncbi:hypothetical protein Pmani_016617 [Petrolisthes manimaculis]|uniref:Uncharacterized protein n=1 Tax=Petrolisthes manimaculis TaxID=1843537 RepID=A0AAE1UAU4_9EUCA|nr:hypothetical protein Pmani_016617 [Petrolisthes manimaculis]
MLMKELEVVEMVVEMVVGMVVEMVVGMVVEMEVGMVVEMVVEMELASPTITQALHVDKDERGTGIH